MLDKFTLESPEDAQLLVDTVRRSAAALVRDSVDDLESQVASILDDVRTRGDAALFEYTERFDGVDLSQKGLEVSSHELESALATVPENTRRAFYEVAEQLRAYFQAQYSAVASQFQFRRGGFDVHFSPHPVKRVGIYVPGGRYRYPSTVLMTVVPAVVAGVKEVVVCTPPQSSCEPDPLVTAAAQIAGADRVFSVGGVQAVAALAYGTETVPRVDMVVGPGNAYVTCAKRLVYGDVGIEALAGPSELVVVADDSAPWDRVAADLAAQAEHGPGGVAVAAVFSYEAADALQAAISKEVEKDSRSALEETLKAGGAIAVCGNEEAALALIDTLAPEHVQVMLSDISLCEALAKKIECAGVVFVGADTPAPYGDYVAGPSHVLPTGGSARFASGLGVYSFLRYRNIVIAESVSDALHQAALDIASLEGMMSHARSLALRREGRSEPGSFSGAPLRQGDE